MEHGRRTLPLPVLFHVDTERPVGNGLIGLSSAAEGWKDVEVSVEGRPLEPIAFPGAFSSALLDGIEGMGLSRFKGLIGSYGAIISIDMGGGVHEAEITSSMLFPMLMKDPRGLSRALCRIKEEDPCHPPIHAPAVADGWNLEALIYMGIEVLDDAACIADANEGRYYTMTCVLELGRSGKAIDPSALCPCKACSTYGSEGDVERRRKLLAEHNRGTLARRHSIALTMLRRGCLRQHVMGSVSGKPEWLAAIRTMEGGAWPSLHCHAHTWKPRDELLVTYRDDLNDPELALWSRRLKEDYDPLKRPVLLLLPCSARKPYSMSRTHQRIRAALSGIKGLRTAVHMVVLTSPLGAVPMELDGLYPAAHYDIPVTGRWFPEESALMRDLVGRLVGKGAYKEIVCYLDGAEEIFPDAVREKLLFGLPFANVPCDPGEGRGLNALHDALSDIVAGHQVAHAGPGPDVEDMLSLARFSLRADLSGFEGLSVKWDRSYRSLVSGRKRVLDARPTGPHLTLHGARRVWEMEGPLSGLKVHIEDFEPTGTVFNQGIRSVSPGIRPGDIVLIGSESGFKALGRALVPGSWMTSGRRGGGVKVLEHA